MDSHRRGEAGSVPFRTGRLFCVNHEWYFATREGEDKGPYETRGEAQAALQLFLHERTVAKRPKTVDRPAPPTAPQVPPHAAKTTSGPRHPLLARLAKLDQYSRAYVSSAVTQILRDPHLFKVVFSGLLDNDPVIRMHAAEAVAKIAAQHPEYLDSYKATLINEVATTQQQEVRWHVAQVLAHLKLEDEERLRVLDILLDYLADPSNIVQVYAMRTLATIGRRDVKLRPEITRLLQGMVETGTPPIKAQGEKLLQALAATPETS